MNSVAHSQGTVSQLFPHQVTEQVLEDLTRLLEEEYAGPLHQPLSAQQVSAATNSTSVLVARNETGTIVGMATLVLFDRLAKRVARIEDVCVLSTERQKGYGRRLTPFALEIATNNQVSQVNLMTHEQRAPAIDLYESCGFKRTDGIDFRLGL